MRKQKALGVNALQEEVEAIDKRREELGLSRAKYLTTLAKIDIEHEILVAEGSEDARPVISLAEGRKPMMRIEKEEMEAWAREIAVKVAKICLIQTSGVAINERELQSNLTRR